MNNPSGFTVASISVSITNFIGTTTDLSNGRGRFEILLPNLGSENVPGNGNYVLTSTLNDSSQLRFRFLGPEDFMNMEAGSMDYVMTINAVPEPSATALLMVALGFGFAFRRKRGTAI